MHLKSDLKPFWKTSIGCTYVVNQCSCWWPGDARSQGINRHDIDIVFLEYSGKCTIRFDGITATQNNLKVLVSHTSNNTHNSSFYWLNRRSGWLQLYMWASFDVRKYIDETHSESSKHMWLTTLFCDVRFADVGTGWWHAGLPAKERCGKVNEGPGWTL